MRSWPRPAVPALPGAGPVPRAYDTSTGSVVELRPDGDVARLYVCGITPYDATHLGHAATYLAFDTMQRLWLDAGYEVHYSQNVTDVDDPLLERATATGVEWAALAEEQTDLFRADMTSLSVLPPREYTGVTEVISEIAAAVSSLEASGVAYRVAAPQGLADDATDVYFDSAAAADGVWHLGSESRLDQATMEGFFAERGGDPDRAGKRDPLDPLLWLAARPGEPSWPSSIGDGRPGWHIECSVIAMQNLGGTALVQGGGSDLVFPHHEFSAGHAAALTGEPLARAYVHAGMVAYEGEKMSKSLGNLVLVSRLRAAGVDPRAIRLAVLGQHYRSDWEWTDTLLAQAEARLAAWTTAFGTSTQRSGGAAATDSAALLDDVRTALANDLDTPAAIRILDAAAATGATDAALVVDAVDALLGVRLDRGATLDG